MATNSDGYGYATASNSLTTEKGVIYNPGSGKFPWVASPSSNNTNNVCNVNGNNGNLNNTTNTTISATNEVAVFFIKFFEFY